MSLYGITNRINRRVLGLQHCTNGPKATNTRGMLFSTCIEWGLGPLTFILATPAAAGDAWPGVWEPPRDAVTALCPEITCCCPRILSRKGIASADGTSQCILACSWAVTKPSIREGRTTGQDCKIDEQIYLDWPRILGPLGMLYISLVPTLIMLHSKVTLLSLDLLPLCRSQDASRLHCLPRDILIHHVIIISGSCMSGAAYPTEA